MIRLDMGSGRESALVGISQVNRPAMREFPNFGLEKIRAMQREQILEQQRLAREQQIAQQQAQQQKPYEIFGVPATGPLAAPLPAVGEAVSSAARAVGGFLTQPAPNFPIKTDSMGRPLQPQQAPTEAERVLAIPKSYPMEPVVPPGARKVPVLDSKGEIVGYGLERVNPISVKPNEVPGQVVPLPTNPMETAGVKQAMGSSYRDLAGYYERSWAQRLEDAVKATWGVPQTENGVEKWNVGTDRDYIGLQPGYVRSPTLPPLPENATEEEARDYVMQARNQIRVPKYTEKDYQRTVMTMSKQEIWEFQKAAKAAGLYDPKASIWKGVWQEEDRKIFYDVLAASNQEGADWKDMLSFAVKQRQQEVQQYGSGGGGGGGTSVYTQVNYSQTSMEQARSMLTQVLQQSLGRDPSDEEVSDFLSLLNAAERKSPTTTTTRTVAGKGSTTATATTTPSGVDAQNMAREFMQKIGGGDEYRTNMAQKYMSWIAERGNYGFGQG